MMTVGVAALFDFDAGFVTIESGCLMLAERFCRKRGVDGRNSEGDGPHRFESWEKSEAICGGVLARPAVAAEGRSLASESEAQKSSTLNWIESVRLTLELGCRDLASELGCFVLQGGLVEGVDEVARLGDGLVRVERVPHLVQGAVDAA